MLAVMCSCAVSAGGWNQLVQAEEDVWPVAPELEGGRAILMEANSGTILYEKNSHEQGYPASITKIATAIVAIENGDFSDEVTFSEDAVFKTEGSGIWRDVDEVMTLEECMYGMMLESANECAYAIAEHVGGGYENFIGMMNAKAAELGCTGTHFNNPHGLPDEEHLTTCYDMALISSYAINNDVFRKIVGTVRYDIPPTNKHEEITYLTNHHKMLKQSEELYYEPCIGGKTGYTMAAGNTLVTFAEQNGLTLVCVVMQENKSSQYADTRLLLDWGFENFTNYNISQNLNTFPEMTTENDFLAGGSFAALDQEAVVTLPAGVAFAEAHQETVTGKDDPLVAGTLQFSYRGRRVGNADITQAAPEPLSYPFQETQEHSQSQNQLGAQESSQDQPEIQEPSQDQPGTQEPSGPQDQPEAQESSQDQSGTQEPSGSQDQPELQSREGQESSGVNPWLIAGIVLGVIALGALGFGIYKFADNFQRIRYLWMNRRGGGIYHKILERKSRKRRR